MSRFRRLRWLIAGPLCVLSSISLMAATRSTPECEGTVALQWVQAHHDELPSTLVGLNRFDASQRKAIFSHVAVTTQVSLWREQLNPYLGPTSRLTKDQQAFIRDVRSKLDLYITGMEDGRGRTAMQRDSLTLRAKRLFGDSLARVIFTQLGSNPVGAVTVSEASVIAPVVSLLRVSAERFGIVSKRGTCNCAPDSDFCLGARCRFTDCVQPIWGCGFFDQYFCEGNCDG